jgi:Icc protein
VISAVGTARICYIGGMHDDRATLFARSQTRSAHAALRVVQVSDSHLSPHAPFSDRHWDAVVAHVAATTPDLVVHTGDISAHGADDDADLRHARRRLEELPVPWLAIPGNHDIGDVDPTEQPIDDTRRSRYADAFGASRWITEQGGWRLVGIDAQTLLSDLPAADDEWQWLQDAVTADVPVALFLHRPLRPWRADTPDEPRRYVSGVGRSRLTALLAASTVRLVGTGHVHQWWSGQLDGTTQVWAPSTWALVPDRVQPVIGDKIVGLVELELAADGTVRSTFVRPDGVTDLRIGDDFPSPYEH